MITLRRGYSTGSVAAVLAVLALAGCSEQPKNQTQGYVEGEFVYVASQIAGTLGKLNVQRGDQVKPGDPLFGLDDTNELAARDQAKAALVYSEAQFLRQQQLYRKGPAAEMDLDQARSNRDQDKQRLAQAEWSLDQKKQSALVGGLVYDTLYQQGEMVPAGKPVVILLPPPNIKVRTFVPQKWLGGIHYGDAVRVTVDGTSEIFSGKVSYISPHAEYTPPVIYSEENRNKLVFMIEMVFAPESAARLHPGQPVQVQFLNNPEGKMTKGDPIIDVRGMTKRFGTHTVVDHVDMQVRAGEIYGFLGPNGSGKTTFLRMLCGLLRADEGSGTCLGYDVIHESEAIKREVGYMTQRFSFWEDLSIEENLDFVTRMYGIKNRRRVVRDSIARLGLTGREKQLAGELSGGWKQRLALAACLIHEPKLLLLDEPTAGVDPKARRDFWDQIHLLAAEGLTFLITTHYMDEAERCHRLAYIAYGRLLAHGTVDAVIKQVGLTTWAVSGPDLPHLAEQLRSQPGVQQAVAFGTALHVSSNDAVALERAVAQFRHDPYQWRQISPGLEDAFISLMDVSTDNFGQ